MKAGERTFVAALNDLVDERVVLHGWATAVKAKGASCGISFRDRTGTTTVVDASNGSSAAWREDITPESALRVVGVVRAGDTQGGSIQIVAEAVTVLSRACAPLPAVGNRHDQGVEDNCLRLRSPSNYLTFAVQSTFEAAVREFLRANSFVEIHTPKLTAGGNESGSNVFEVSYFGTPAFLVQATQFYVQRAIASGFDRVFEIGPVFRAESSNTGRHAVEFTGIDFELSWIDSHHDVMDVEESLLGYALTAVEEEHGEQIRREFGVVVELPRNPIPRIPFYRAREIVNRESAAGPDRLTHREEGLLSRYAKQEFGSSFIFITDFPADDKKFADMRADDGNAVHPTTTRSFDLIWRGIEISTGDQPEHRYDRLQSQLARSGLDRGTCQDYLEPYYLEMFRYGCPPHGGVGIGLSRLLMALLGRASIRETTFVFRGSGRPVP
jgi:aspartyl-tRNA synthetase